MPIDLNCDLGEGSGLDAVLMPLITSASVACGGHAGGPAEMAAALQAAADHGVQVGAHPGYFDREAFGRRELRKSEEEVFQECLYQLGALQALAEAVSLPVRYLKPHGGLYHQACREAAYARSVVRAARAYRLAVMGLPGSELARQCGAVRFVAEGFADRRYAPDGGLLRRGQPGALIDDPLEAARQAIELVRSQGVETICVHGDNPRAVEFVRRLRESLTKLGMEIRAFDPFSR